MFSCAPSDFIGDLFGLSMWRSCLACPSEVERVYRSLSSALGTFRMLSAEVFTGYADLLKLGANTRHEMVTANEHRRGSTVDELVLGF